MKNEQIVSPSLVEAFGDDIKLIRRDCNHQAEKSMTRTMLLVTVFCFAVLVQAWIS